MARFIKIQDYLAAKFPKLVCGVEYRQSGNSAEYVWLESRPRWTRAVPGFPARFVVYPPDLSRESLLEWAEAIEVLLDSSGWSWLVPEGDCLAALRSVSQYVARQSKAEACSLDGLEPGEALLVFCRWLQSEAFETGPYRSGQFRCQGKTIEMGTNQWALLAYLWQHGKSQEADVAKYVWWDAGTPTSTINSLVSAVNRKLKNADIPLRVRRSGGEIWIENLD